MRTAHLGFLFLVLALAACVSKHDVVVNGGGVAIGAPLSTVADGPFRLLFGGPKGPVAGSTDVTLAFSRAVPTTEAPASIVRDDDNRAVAGTWQWFGEAAAAFHPEEPFALATTYRVEPRRLLALDGSTLDGASALPFTFTTARPKLERVSYQYDEKKSLHLVDLTFDQAIAARSATEAIRIEDGTAKRVDFRVVGEDGKGRTLTLQVDASVARLEGVVVIATTALRGVEGPLGPVAEARLPLEGVGPFRVKLTCTTSETSRGCDPTSSIQLEATHEVNERDFLRHLVIPAPLKANPEELKAIRERDSYPTSSFDLGTLLSVGPGKKYRVTLTAGLVANDKQRLTSDQVIEFETLDSPPSLAWSDLDSPVMIVESARRVLPINVSTTNVPAFDVVSAPLDESQLARFLVSPKAVNAATVRALPKSVVANVVAEAPKNQSKKATVNVAADRAVGGAGAWVVASHASALEDEVHLLSITDLGVNTKWSPHGALVWVTRLSTAEPVSGASISLRRVNAASMMEAFSTTTDGEGIATIPAEIAATFLHEESDADAPAPMLFVKHEADWTFTRLPELDASLMSAIGDVFVERGLYRPGETVLAKGYFRIPSPKGLESLAGKTVYLEALDAANHIFSAQTTTLDAFGAFSAEVAIPTNAALGRSYLRARVGSKAPPLVGGRERWSRWGGDRSWPARDSFLIDSFRTPEFKVEAKIDRKNIVRGESVSLITTGMYLLGAPMTNVAVNVDVTRYRTSFTPPGLESFSVSESGFGNDPPESVMPKSKLAGKLDSAGRASFAYPIPPTTTLARPEWYTFDVDIGDVSRAFSMGDRATVLVHPSDVYLGIKANLGAPPLVPGKSVRAELVAAGIDGTRRAGVAAKIELFRATEKGEPVTTNRSCTVTTESAKVAACDLIVSAEGRHWLEATALDTSGRAIAAADAFVVEPKDTKPPPPVPFVAAEPPTPAPTFEQECRRPATKGWMAGLSIERNTASYRVGEDALVCLRTTAEPRTKNARGLFTLEREGVLRRAPMIDFGASESRLMKVPMTEDLYPNADVVLAEEKGRVAPFPPPGHRDSGFPSFSDSSQRLAITVSAKRLAVAIQTEKEARPGSEIELRVKVTDGENRPTAAQVTLWAIDEGIDLLAPKHVPTPETTFGAQRYSDVVATDTRKNIFFDHGDSHMTRSPTLRQGGTSISDRNLVGRSVFKPTAFFLTNIITGANGAASVRAKLPDNLTTWKVFAVAATTSDFFGEGQASFQTNQPLMLRPQLPRFLRAGDHFDGMVMIDSLVKEPIEVALSVRASGVLEAKSPDASVTIPAEGHVLVHLPVAAKAVGAGKLVFEAKSTKGLHDEVTVDEDVASLASIESVVVAGEIPQAKAATTVNEPLGDLSKVRSDIGGFDYQLATTPLVGLGASLNDLVEYPYGCTEQLTSRLVPLIRLRGMAKDLGVVLPSNIDAVVRSSLASLLTHQQSDGGFGFWRESKKSEAWLTVLALGALDAAREHGYLVPASSVEATQKWLEKRVDLDHATSAMREDLFASAGKARPAELRALAADPTLPLFARALTAHALVGVDRDLARTLLDRIVTGAQVSGAVVTFADEPSLAQRTYLSSDARTTAIVLRALLAVEPQNPLVPRVVRGLLSLRRDGRFRTTQDSVWALTALEDARALYRPVAGHTTVEFLFDQHVVAKTAFEGAPGGETRTGTIAMSRLLGAPGASVSFASDGARPLFFEGSLRYARTEPPMSPLDHGITVARSLRPLAATSGAIHVGDYVVADLVVVTGAPRDLVVLDDPIPAGFEAVNGTFASMDEAAPLVVDPALTLTHRELHDDRVVSFFDSLPAGVTHTRYVLRTTAAGHFAQPPARAECMYAPDTFGRTASTWVDSTIAGGPRAIQVNEPSH